MSYTPTVWVTGDIVTAEKLNKLENGVKDVSDNVVIATIGEEYITLNKTADEIYQNAANIKILLESEGITFVIYIIAYSYTELSGYTFYGIIYNTSATGYEGIVFTAATDNDYPQSQLLK